MADELEPIGAEPEEEAVAEVSSAQRNTAVWKHPQRENIVALLRRGKSAEWIQYWLEDEYPSVDEDPELDATTSRQHMRWRLRAATIEEYREKYMPETAKGIEVIDSELEDLVGRRLPAGMAGPAFEVEVLETSIRVAQLNLTQALKSDAEMKMLTSTTLDANDRLANLAEKSVDVKQKLGLPGYEPLPEHKIVEQTNKNLNANLHGVFDPRTGKLGPANKEAIGALRELMAKGPEAAQQIVEAARQQTDVEGTAEEVPPDGEG
jgi:hypothetical protein